MTKFFLSAAVVLSLFAAPFVSLPVRSQSSDFELRVIVTQSLNLRDKNCNIVNKLSYGTQVRVLPEAPFTCKINGQSLKMIALALNGIELQNVFIAEMYTKPVLRNANLPILGGKMRTRENLNLRDENCRRITTVSAGTELETVPVGGGLPVCQRDSQFYQMTPLYYNGKMMFAANLYLQKV